MADELHVEDLDVEDIVSPAFGLEAADSLKMGHTVLYLRIFICSVRSNMSEAPTADEIPALSIAMKLKSIIELYLLHKI